MRHISTCIFDSLPRNSTLSVFDYDEGSQSAFASNFTDPDSEEASQKYQPRKQK